MKKGWEVTTLGDIYDIGSSKRVLQSQWKSVGVPFYRAREIVKLSKLGKVENELFISEEHFHELQKSHGVPAKGDLMVSAVGTLGACYIVEGHDRFYFKDASVLWFRPKTKIDPYFMKYAFQWDGLVGKVIENVGATVGTLTISRANSITLPLPPFEEQQRIVAILDEAFEGLDRARANAEANLQSAKELFVNSLAMRTNSEDFSKVQLNEICDVRDGTHDTPKYVENGVPLVTQKNVRPEGLSLSDVKLISEADHNAIHRRSNVAQGDILISMIGANRGMSCLVDCDDIFSSKNVGLIKSTSQINMEFLLFYLQSADAERYVAEATNGGAQPFIGLGKLRTFPVPFPERQLQDKIATGLIELREATRLLTKNYQFKLLDLSDLRQSLLQKAFAGELT